MFTHILLIIILFQFAKMVNTDAATHGIMGLSSKGPELLTAMAGALTTTAVYRFMGTLCWTLRCDFI